MILLKYIILINIFCICTYIGFFKSKILENRVIELSKFENGLNMFCSKLQFTYEPIKNIFEEISRVIYNDTDNVFLYTITGSKDIYKSWCEGVQNNNFFNKEDKDIIKMIGKLIGKTDISGQVSEISLGIDLVKKQMEKAENEKNKSCKLYKTMGIVLGMGVCIILI